MLVRVVRDRAVFAVRHTPVVEALPREAHGVAAVATRFEQALRKHESQQREVTRSPASSRLMASPFVSHAKHLNADEMGRQSRSRGSENVGPPAIGVHFGSPDSVISPQFELEKLHMSERSTCPLAKFVFSRTQ